MTTVVTSHLDAPFQRVGLLRSLLALMRLRTWVFAASAFFFAYSMSGDVVLWKMVLGTLICMLTTGATNLINAYTDREEDAINQPVRVSLVANVGIEKIKEILVCLYAGILALSTLLGLWFFLFASLAVFDSIFYSLPPLRFKKHILSGMLAFTGVVAFSFLAGWVLSSPINSLPPVFYVATYFFFTYNVFKNIPDYVGDSKGKVKTFMTMFHPKQGIFVSYILLITPYFLLALFLALGLLSKEYIFAFILFPVLIYNGYFTVNAGDTARMERLHSYGFLYGVTFLLLIFFISVPTVTSLATVAFFYVFLFLVTKAGIDSRSEVKINVSNFLTFQRYAYTTDETPQPCRVGSRGHRSTTQLEEVNFMGLKEEKFKS